MTSGKHIYEYTDAKGIAVIGDVHCHFEQLVYKCCLEYKLTDTLIIVAGDCGFGFFGTRYYVDIYKKLSKRLAECNNWVVFVRGNHDNPAYFDGQQVNYDRWRAVPDYSVQKACGRTILCVGGAISADRSWRLLKNLGRTVIEGEDETFLPDVYWPAERPVYDEAKLGAIDKQCTVDVVITHSAPSFCEKQSQGDIQNWLFKDKNLADDIKQEHMVMDDILGYLTAHSHPLQYWFYGHFHESWHGEIDGVQYNMLDVMEIRLLTDSGAQSLPHQKRAKSVLHASLRLLPDGPYSKDNIMKPNYYTTYLKAYLTAAGDLRKDDDSFIEDRAELASAEYEDCRRDGMTVFAAQECAMKVLLEGLK